MMSEADNFDDFLKKNFDDENPESKERRKSKRLDQQFPAKLKDEKCIALNISEKGVLLQTRKPAHFFPIDKRIVFELKLQEQWIKMKGKVVWQHSDSFHRKIGVLIQKAPKPYSRFFQELEE